LFALRPLYLSRTILQKKKGKERERESEGKRKKETATSKLANKQALRRYLIDWANQADVWRLDCAARYLSAANIDVYVERPFRVRERRITAEARSLHEN